ncbi:hypothetical protein DPEC_G00303820 [Dallia pectoralis]|uniref:Uncharacterized protein n=1 Tax=Dallia pectoralis TaxID=75939 RepID=A0ACC2FDL7_DALPE|nr:hypothetical protein DPEC_G00303820 [Dallia pectoralis]
MRPINKSTGFTITVKQSTCSGLEDKVRLCGILKMQTNNVVRVLFKDCKKYVFSPTPFTFKTFLECVAKKFDLPTMDEKMSQRQRLMKKHLNICCQNQTLVS